MVLASEAVVIAAATAWHPKVQGTAPGRPLSRGLLGSQRAQYPLIKEYGLSYIGLNIMI